MQQAMSPSHVRVVTPSFQSNSPSSQALGSYDIRALGDRLQLTYSPVEAPLPVRLAELVERLTRREQARD
jgi:hypothetical protein